MRGGLMEMVRPAISVYPKRDCKLQNEHCKLIRSMKSGQFAICIYKFAICNHDFLRAIGLPFELGTREQ